MKKIKKNTGLVLMFVLMCSLLPSQGVLAAKLIYELNIAQESSKLQFGSNFEGGQLGSALIAGDFNNDGYDDLAMSSPLASSSGKRWNGAVTVQFGGQAGTIGIFGRAANEELGRALTVGDFNHDGIDDLVIGAHKGKGRIYIIYGNENLATKSIDLDLRKADMEIEGKGIDSGFGLTLYSKDLNQDGFDDLLVGAPFAGENGKTGMLYGYYGNKLGLATKNELTIYGQQPEERFASAISSGDLNGDGIVDIFVSAYRANTSSFNQAGKVYVYWGKQTHSNIVSSADLELQGIADGGWFGFSISSGDLDEDGVDDLAVSQFPFWGDRTNAKVAVIKGSAELEEKKLLVADDQNDLVSIKGAPSGLVLASKIALDDLNNDGHLDILIGAPGAEVERSEREGNFYLIENHNFLKENYYLDQSDFDTVIHGEKRDDWFGDEFATLDYNGDGYRDLAVSAIYADGKDSVDNGMVYLIAGGAGKIGVQKTIIGNGSGISRGEVVERIVNSFELAESRKTELDNCREFSEFCLFNFIASSSYNDIALEPVMQLYPDVQVGEKYYEAINIATMLGFVNGFANETDSPFHPEAPVTRIQALKMVLSAKDLVKAKYRFELIGELGSYEALAAQESTFSDVDAAIDHMWWYPRYVNYAVENDLIDRGELFRPDEYITGAELDNLLERVHEKTKS